jgi:hypothetical protein
MVVVSAIPVVAKPAAIFLKSCCAAGAFWYIARSVAPERGAQELTETIYRQLFFVWLDNAFVSD